MKIGIADYGMLVWYGGVYDYEDYMSEVKKMGYLGVERLRATDAAEAMERLAVLARLKMDFATVETGNIERNIRWTAGLGKEYIWDDKSAYIPNDYDMFVRNTRYLCKAAAKYGIVVSLHNHLGSLVESQSELERFLADCPRAGLILDVGHLGGAGGDAEYIADKYFDRITAVHIKDWYVRDPSAGEWYKRGYFTALGLGNVDVNNEGVVRLLKKRAYDKWLMVELDSHKEEPQKELSGCLETVKGWLE